MREKARRLAAALLVLLLLAGCQGKPLPSGMEEEELLRHGREVAALLAGGNYEEVYGLMREDVAGGTKVEDIQNLVIQQTDGAGTYKQIDSAMVTGQSSNGEAYGVAVLYCDYSKTDVLFRLAFDADYKLIGMEIKRQ